METQKLINVMKYHLANFNKSGAPVTDDTILKDVLNKSDGYGPANSAELFKGFTKWTLVKEIGKGEAKKRWPGDWMDFTVSDLAAKLLALVMLLIVSVVGMAQTQLNVGTVKTVNRNTAINIGIEYAKSLDSTWKNQDFFFAGNRSFFTLAPAVDIQYGTADAFSSINVKATGLFTTFKVTEVDGIKTPNSSRTFHAFPISLGAEADNTFQRINGIAELGWVPWYQSEGNSTPDFLKRTKFGLFLQGGYKFYPDSTGDREIFRAKGNFTIDTRKILNVQGLNIGLVGSADAWYDFLHQAVYYKIEGKGRVFLTDKVFFDMEYQKGSGAPNFFQGDQYGVGLTVTF